MLLAYVDESHDKRNYWIAALLCEEVALGRLTADLDAVVAKAAEDYGVTSAAELHGNALFHGKEDWAPMAPLIRARIGVYTSALEAIGAAPVEIFIRGVDRKRLAARYRYPDHPHAVCLNHLVERLDERAAMRDELVLVIADEIESQKNYREQLAFAQRHNTGGYRSRQLSHIVDTIHFAPSSASRLLQAADLVVFLHRRIAAREDSDPRAVEANKFLWAHIERSVRHSHQWVP